MSKRLFLDLFILSIFSIACMNLSGRRGGSELGGQNPSRSEVQKSFNAEVSVERPVKLPGGALELLKKNERVQSCLSERKSELPISSWFEASEIHLNDDGRVDLIVVPRNGCLFGANVIPFWVLLNSKQGYRIALQAQALHLEVQDTRTRGHLDITTSAVIRARDVAAVKYKYNGERYLPSDLR